MTASIERLTLTPPNQQQGIQLGFNAMSVIVDNPTHAYWYLPDVQRFIAPFYTGVIVPLHGVQQAKILYQAPAGLQQPTLVVQSEAASFLFTTDELQADSGTALGNAAFGRSVSVIPINFSTPQTTYTFVQPAPDGFVIVPETAVAGPVNSVFVDLAYGGPLAGNLFVKRLWAQTTINKLPSGDYAQVVYRRPIPAQSTLLVGGSGLPALLMI